MANRDINILIKLKDEFTGSINKVNNSLNDFGRNIDRTGKQISQLGMKMTFLGGAITGGFALALRNVSAYSPAVNNALGSINNSLLQLQMVVAQAILPVLNQFNNLIYNLTERFKALDPHTRDTILRIVLLTGVFITLGGLILKVTGTLTTIIGKLITLATAGNGVGLAIMIIVGALVVMIQKWDKVRTFVMPILDKLQIGVDMVTIGFLKLASATSYAVEMFMKFHGVNVSFKAMRERMSAQIKMLEDDISNVINKGTSTWANDLDNGVNTINGFVEQIKGLMDDTKIKVQDVMIKWADMGETTAKQIAGAMSQHLGNFFYNVLTRQITSAKEMFADFGRSVLQILTQVMAKLMLEMLLAKTIRSMTGISSFSFFHKGGVVKRAHTGMLATDEVPIIAQRGEGIVSRKGMNALGVAGFNKMNRGEGGGGGGVVINVNPIIQAWDASDIYRNKEMITNIIGQAIRGNSDIRKIIKEYA